MRVLIVATNRERVPMPVVPIGACIVAAAAEEAGHEVRLVDLMWVRRPKRVLARALRDFQPEIVGLSVRNMDDTAWLRSNFYLGDARGYVRQVKAHGVPAIVGGACLGVHPGPITAYLEADAGIWGDGEEAFVQLLERARQGQPWHDVDGVVTVPEGGEPRVNPQRMVSDIGTVPRSRVWRWLDYDRYAPNNGPLPIQARRGCVFDCDYCTYKAIEGGTYRTRPVDAVVAELAETAERYPGGSVEFVDSTFNVPLPYTLDLCRAIADAKLDLLLQTSDLNPGAVDGKLMPLMQEAGFNQVLITPEVASDTMLKNLNKGFTMEHVRQTARNRRDVDFAVMWIFMLGGWEETEQTLDETFEFLATEIPSTDLVFLQPGLRVYPNTGLQRKLIEAGRLSSDDPLLEPYYYISPHVPEMRLRDLIVEQIEAHPNYITIKDVLHPLLPLYMRFAHWMGIEAPLSRAPGGLARLASIGMRRPKASV